MSKQKEESYQLTPLGLFSSRMKDQREAHLVAEALELYLRKHNKAVAIEDNVMRFVNLVQVEENR